jgi:hypothetical protein
MKRRDRKSFTLNSKRKRSNCARNSRKKKSRRRSDRE